jgi:hypothetical protein
MKVFVEACWGSSSGFWQRLVFRQYGRVIRDSVPGYLWTRAVASQALNLLESVYHLPRRKVRFKHR